MSCSSCSCNVACTCTAAAAAANGGGGGGGHDCALLPDGPARSGWQHVVGSARGFIGQLGPEHSTAVFSTATRAMRVAVASGFGVSGDVPLERPPADLRNCAKVGGSRRSGPLFELIVHRVVLGYRSDQIVVSPRPLRWPRHPRICAGAGLMQVVGNSETDDAVTGSCCLDIPFSNHCHRS